MSALKHAPNPERLVEGRFGRLLQAANREFAEELDQRAAFHRVTARLSSSRNASPTRAYWLTPATLLVLAAIIAVPIATLLHRAGSDVTALVAAEDLRGFRAKPALVASTTPTPAFDPSKTSPEQRKSASSGKTNPKRAGVPALARIESRGEPRAVLEGSPPKSSDVSTLAPEAAESPAAPDCLSLARRGQTHEAEACFLKRAAGSGLGAEMALYEVARLRRDVLADAAGALATLAEYRRRFPSGSLRREADMSQLELLLQLGRSDEALKQSDELLSSSSSGERAAELHLLRGHILRKARARFAAAAHEYELAESAGMRGDVTYYRALCSEALGNAPEAVALFSKYLEQPERPYSADARRHLAKLKP